jgi:two-component system, cell cycle response regulator
MQQDGEQLQRRPRLLAIDDSTMIHRLLKARLKGERLDIHCATCGQQGLEVARSLLPEVILLDILMDDMDGFQVLDALKADPVTHDIPVIIISGQTETEIKIRGLEMGAIDFVTKPFDVGELLARVRSALRIRLLIQLLAQRAQIDGLTGLWNRAYFDQRLMDEISLAQRHGTALSLIMCDLDRFKLLNDTYGHPFGDQVLEQFAHMLAESRTGDIACRYGGEEFALILPQTPAEDAMIVAQRVRDRIRVHRFSEGQELQVTASFGVTDLRRCLEASPKSMVTLADDALYAAKQHGRDRVELAADPGHPQRLSA